MSLDIKQIRETLRMTQAELADAMGIHFSTFSQTERGRTEISYEFICRLAEVLGIDTEELLFQDGKRSKPPVKQPTGEWWVSRLRLALRGLTDDQVQTVIYSAEAAAKGEKARAARLEKEGSRGKK